MSDFEVALDPPTDESEVQVEAEPQPTGDWEAYSPETLTEVFDAW